MRKIGVLIGVLLIIGLFAAALPALAQGTVVWTTHVVQPGDRLAKIAQQNCTTWQEIYNLNAATIGPDPNVLRPGMVLTVPNRCGTSGIPPSCTVWDRGPRQHAMGTVQGNVYTVAWGDTWTSIGQRFGTTPAAIQQGNGLPTNASLFANSRLIIPGLCGPGAPPSGGGGSSFVGGCSIWITPALTVFSGPNFNTNPIGVTQAGTRYEVLGASVPGYGSSRWFPIEGFRIPGWVNVFPGQFELIGQQCLG
jgi:LysM repeat protein